MLCSSWESSGAGKESSPLPPPNALLSCRRGVLSLLLTPCNRCCRAEHSPNPFVRRDGADPGASTALHPGTGSSPCPSHRAPSSSLLLNSATWSSDASLPPRREQSAAPGGGGPAGGEHHQFLPICSSPAAAAQPSSHSSDCAGRDWKWSFGSPGSPSIHPCAAIFPSPVITEVNRTDAEHQECNDGSQEFPVLSSQRGFGRRNDPAANAQGWLPIQLTACIAFPHCKSMVIHPSSLLLGDGTPVGCSACSAASFPFVSIPTRSPVMRAHRGVCSTPATPQPCAMRSALPGPW